MDRITLQFKRHRVIEEVGVLTLDLEEDISQEEFDKKIEDKAFTSFIVLGVEEMESTFTSVDPMPDPTWRLNETFRGSLALVKETTNNEET